MSKSYRKNEWWAKRSSSPILFWEQVALTASCRKMRDEQKLQKKWAMSKRKGNHRLFYFKSKCCADSKLQKNERWIEKDHHLFWEQVAGTPKKFSTGPQISLSGPAVTVLSISTNAVIISLSVYKPQSWTKSLG